MFYIRFAKHSFCFFSSGLCGFYKNKQKRRNNKILLAISRNVVRILSFFSCFCSVNLWKLCLEWKNKSLCSAFSRGFWDPLELCGLLVVSQSSCSNPGLTKTFNVIFLFSIFATSGFYFWGRQFWYLSHCQASRYNLALQKVG